MRLNALNARRRNQSMGALRTDVPVSLSAFSVFSVVQSLAFFRGKKSLYEPNSEHVALSAPHFDELIDRCPIPASSPTSNAA